MAFLASVSQFLGKTFALWVLVFAGLAYVSPDSFKFFAPYISPLLGIIMFGIGLTLKASDFSEVFRRPMAVAIGFFRAGGALCCKGSVCPLPFVERMVPLCGRRQGNVRLKCRWYKYQLEGLSSVSLRLTTPSAEGVKGPPLRRR